MGGTAALIVAARVPVAGIATLSAPAAFAGLDAAAVVAKLTGRKLFLAAELDTSATEAAKRFAAAAGDVRTLQIFPGNEHGTALLDGAAAAPVQQALRAFLTAPSP